VLLRGQTWRQGATGSQANLDDEAPQLHAFDSVRRHVLEPAVSRGWNVSLALDITVPPKFLLRLVDHLSSHPLTRPLAMRAQPAFTTRNQVLSLISSLAWALDLADERYRVRRAGWHGLLLLRSDLEFKADLSVPSPARMSATVWAPFVDRGMTEQGQPRVADTMLLLPRSRSDEFLEVLRRLPQPSPHHASLHPLCDYIPAVDFFEPTWQYDADPGKEWNPLYRIIGRGESTIHRGPGF